MPPADLRSFLPHRAAELIQLTDELRERLAPKEREYLELCAVLDSLGVPAPKELPQRPIGPQKDPTTLHEYLYRRHHDLTREMEAIKNALAPKDRELAEIRKATAKLEELAALPSPLFSAAAPALQTTPEGGAGTGRTIKQLIIEALFAHFNDGATGVELRDYFLTVHGRDIDRTSISPQLTRLREEGIVEQMTGPDEGKWKLVLLRGVSADELIAIGHWPAGAEHAPRTDETEQPSGVKRRKVE
jgi:hypothetical protein